MNAASRIFKCVTGILIIVLAVVMMMWPEWGYLVINAVLGLTLLISAIRNLVYYFRMARHMVGGRNTLYSALIQLDLAMFTLTLTNIPKIFIMIYLVSVFGVTGLLRLLRGLEAKKRNAPAWYGSFINGVVYLLITVLCTIFISNTTVMVIVFCVGLIFVGLSRVVSAFQRAKIVYVQ